MPTRIMKPFFTSNDFFGPNVTHSITAGNIRARKELANAPINEISKSRCGTRDEIPPEKEYRKLVISFKISE